MMKSANRKILAVDDEEMNLELIEVYLESGGYECDCVTSGEQALTALNDKKNEYSCILLDRKMPSMDGMEVLRKVKSNERFSRLPVIMQTALDGSEYMREGLEAGAYYYLTKPYDSQMLLTIVNAATAEYMEYCELRESLREATHSLKMMQKGYFTFKTISEGRNLAVLLAKTCSNADAVVMGLSELMVNAVEHGNLNIGYDEKSMLISDGSWLYEVERRLVLDEYNQKEVKVNFERYDNEIVFTITDQGNGFDWNEYMSVSPERALNSHGRGIAMANALSFDKMEYHGTGNEVRVSVRSRV